MFHTIEPSPATQIFVSIIVKLTCVANKSYYLNIVKLLLEILHRVDGHLLVLLAEFLLQCHQSVMASQFRNLSICLCLNQIFSVLTEK